MKILNLGCGTKTNLKVINIDWSIYLRIRKNKLLYGAARFIIKGERLKKLENIPANILVHDLSKGIPFPANSFDAVYHSHFLEHLDRNVVESFLFEVKRVLKVNGIQRIVVPDFERICRNYIKHIELCNNNAGDITKHDDFISALIGQSVMKEAFSTSQQANWMRFLENIILGDARKRGITHQWMYDRINLSVLLESVGFRDITIEKYNTSSIPDWNIYCLDLDETGMEYKPGSLYIEAKK